MGLWDNLTICSRVESELMNRWMDEEYTLMPNEERLRRKYQRRAGLNGLVVGSLVFAANMLIFNRVLRSTSIYKFRYISGAVLGSYAAGLANNILKSNHLRELLRLENSPLAIEARVILCEKEGKDGPWYKANGPQREWPELAKYFARLDESQPPDESVTEGDVQERESDHYLGYELIRKKRPDAIPSRAYVESTERKYGPIKLGKIGSIESAMVDAYDQVPDATRIRLETYFGTEWGEPENTEEVPGYFAEGEDLVDWQKRRIREEQQYN